MQVYAKGEAKVVEDESDIALAGLEKKDVEQCVFFPSLFAAAQGDFAGLSRWALDERPS